MDKNFIIANDECEQAHTEWEVWTPGDTKSEEWTQVHITKQYGKHHVTKWQIIPKEKIVENLTLNDNNSA